VREQNYHKYNNHDRRTPTYDNRPYHNWNNYHYYGNQHNCCPLSIRKTYLQT
jgi:hypothetical protein